MLLLQTAFEQEFAAVKAAGTTIPQSIEPAITIADKKCFVLMTGIGPRAARHELAAMLDRIEQPELVLSIGLAGGLQPQLKFGQAMLVDRVQLLEVGRPSQAFSQAVPQDDAPNEEQRRPERAILREIPSNLNQLSSNLRGRMSVYNLLSLSAPALTGQAKQKLAKQTSAAACDMETYAVAHECKQRRIPWIGARVISDTASDNIPVWIMTLPRLVEQKRWMSLLGRVATHPQDLPSLIGLAVRMQRLKPILTQLTIDLVTHVLPA